MPYNGKKVPFDFYLAVHWILRHQFTIFKSREFPYFRAAAIAPWFHLHLPSCGPGFGSQAHHLPLFQFVLFKMQWEQNENKQKDAGIGITSFCYPPIIPCLGQGNSIPIFTYIFSSIKSPTSTAHPNGFYWGHQCSWTLTPANNTQYFYIILLFILTLFYYLCCGFAILGLMGVVSSG